MTENCELFRLQFALRCAYECASEVLCAVRSRCFGRGRASPGLFFAKWTDFVFLRDAVIWHDVPRCVLVI
jgi:hypothetical protein